MSDVTLDRGTMDIHQLSTYGLLMLYQAVKLALDEDDGNPEDRLFQVRENSDWRDGRTRSRANSITAARTIARIAW